MKKVIGAVTVEELRAMLKGKSRGSLVYIVIVDDKFYIETTTPFSNKEALKIISTFIDDRGIQQLPF